MKPRKSLLLLLIIPVCILALALPALAEKYEFSDAVSAFKSGNYDEAIKICDKLPYSNKKDLLLGNVYLHKGDSENARKHFKNVIINNRFYLLADYARLGSLKSFYHAGEYDQVLERGAEFIISDGDSPVIPEVLLLLGKAYFQTEKHNKAAQLFKKVIDDPDSYFLRVEAQYHLAGCYELTGDQDAANKIYKEIKETSPEDEFAKKSAEKLGKVAEPKKHLSYMAAAEDLYNQGTESFNTLHYGPARETFRKIIKSYPKSKYYDDALMMIGRCDYRMQKYSSAKKIFRQAVNLGGDAADDAQYYIAFVYGREGDLDRTLKAFRAVVKYFPKSEFADDAQYYIGYYNEIHGNQEAAINAYKALLDNFDNSELLDDVALKVGMLQYNKGHYATAAETFRKGHQELPKDDMTSACLFWHAKCTEKIGKKEEAKALFQSLSKNYNHTYYAHRAREILKDYGVQPEMPETEGYVIIEPSYVPKRDNQEVATLIRIWQEAKNKSTGYDPEEEKECTERARALMELGLYQYAAIELMKETDHFNQKTVSNIGVLLTHAGEYTAPVNHFEWIIKKSAKENSADKLPPETWVAAYPLAYWPEVKKQAEAYGIDPLIVLAIMREESRFNPAVTSSASARGLMQIIRSTGRTIAKQLGLENYYTNKLYDPHLNIKMGTYYYSSVLKRFDGNHALALAGYNGGPANVSKWVKEHEKEKGFLDIDEFIEHIPYRETRYYVKKVLNSYYEYKRIYGDRG